MRELTKVEGLVLYDISTRYDVMGIRTEDHCTRFTDVVDTLKEEGHVYSDAATILNELIELGLIVLDDHMPLYSPTKAGNKYCDDMMGYSNNEPAYTCLCRGANFCIQCNPKQFM
jgi:hypothetical protein